MAMNSRPLRAGGRSIGLLVLAILVAGIVGSVVSYFMAGVFPHGPVRDFFFKSLGIGIPTFTVSLGFATLTFGLSFAVTTVAVLLVALAVYLWYKF
jgi:presenilin-like A22 family membrane protease